MEKFSERLREILLKKGISQKELADLCEPICQEYGLKEIDKSLINQYLHERCKPKQDRLYVLAQALNVAPAWLMGYDVDIELNKSEQIQLESQLSSEATKQDNELYDDNFGQNAHMKGYMRYEEQSRRIRKALSDADMKPIELAERTGIPRSTISHYYNGVNVPTLQKALLISKVLRCDPQWLMGLDDLDAPIAVMPELKFSQISFAGKNNEEMIKSRQEYKNNKKKAAYMSKLAKLNEEHFDIVSELIDQFWSEESDNNT